MTTLQTIIVVVQVLTALAIIALVLIQHGKGADMGASFGSGASGSLFGATGSSNFLSKSTGVAAAIFFAATLALAWYANRPAQSRGGVIESGPASTAPAPAAPAVGVPPASGTPGATGGPAAPAKDAPAAAATKPAAPAPAAPASQSGQIPK